MPPAEIDEKQLEMLMEYLKKNARRSGGQATLPAIVLNHDDWRARRATLPMRIAK
jgi:hypothetical protein